MSKPTREELKQAVIDFNFISDIAEKKRTPIQVERYDSALNLLRDNAEFYFEDMTKNLFEDILLEFEDRSGWMNSILLDGKYKAPALRRPVTQQSIDMALEDIYEAQTTVAGVLEEVEPTYKRWLQFEDRAEKLFNAIGNFKDKWKGESVFQVMMPEDVFRKLRNFGEFVAAFKLRQDALDKAFEIISRMITVRQMSPLEPHTRVARPELGHDKPSFRDRMQERSIGG